MPRLTAPQLLWTGVALVVLGIVGGWVGQAIFLELVYRASWLWGFAQTVGNALTVVGAALIGAACVVGALQVPRSGAYPAVPGEPEAAPAPGGTWAYGPYPRQPSAQPPAQPGAYPGGPTPPAPGAVPPVPPGSPAPPGSGAAPEPRQPGAPDVGGPPHAGDR
ncbi:hypothetical protein [Cellulomonas pakistanensis]|uniref:Uncharacterized protein n=1 Tax=Cellulomonas pakistanensis TaxID=992287 RepID=A0A919U6K1_9CELL|nr:hypothetical protein [Cellulomonas pakistanensis]GIG36117.1 hypothetical protein Cpa01nite_14980 [Cellulomonas pakistanensis]